jgi:hypothetical protein
MVNQKIRNRFDNKSIMFFTLLVLAQAQAQEEKH